MTVIVDEYTFLQPTLHYSLDRNHFNMVYKVNQSRDTNEEYPNMLQIHVFTAFFITTSQSPHGHS